MALIDYLERIMKEKHLSARDVAKLSGGEIGHATVSKILAGKMKRPSLPTLRAIAKGIDEPEADIIRESGGPVVDSDWTPKSLARAITKIVSSPELTQAVKLLLRYNSREIKAALPAIEEELSKTGRPTTKRPVAGHEAARKGARS